MLDPMRIIYGLAFVTSIGGFIYVLWLEYSNWRKRKQCEAEEQGKH